MKNEKPISLFFIALFLIMAVTFVSAQQKFDSDSPNPQDNPPNRGNILRELGLNQDQIQQIRMLRAERRPLLMEAQQRMRQAQRNLDQAIYADAFDEAAVQLHLKELITAQAEMTKIRAMDELEMRKILTPEQLTTFRQIRERVQQMRRKAQQRRQNRQQNVPLDQTNDRPKDQQNRRTNQRTGPQRPF